MHYSRRQYIRCVTSSTTNKERNMLFSNDTQGQTAGFTDHIVQVLTAGAVRYGQSQRFMYGCGYSQFTQSFSQRTRKVAHVIGSRQRRNVQPVFKILQI